MLLLGYHTAIICQIHLIHLYLGFIKDMPVGKALVISKQSPENIKVNIADITRALC